MFCSFALQVAAVAAFTNVGNPLAPGNLNFPDSGAAFTAGGNQGLPEVNVVYRFPTESGRNLAGVLAADSRIAGMKAESDLNAQALRGSFVQTAGDNLLTAMANVPAQGKVDDKFDATEFLNGLNSAAPASFISSGDEAPKQPSVLNLALDVPEYQTGAGFANQQAEELNSIQATLGDEARELTSLAAKTRKGFLESESHSATESKYDDKDQMALIEKALVDDCGNICIEKWHELLGFYGGESKSLQETVNAVAEGELTRGTEFLRSLASTHTSFSQWSPTDSPCYDARTCALVETVANKCTIARTAALATYQAMNLAAHVLAVVAKVGCGCLTVFTQSQCFGKALPWCNPINSVFEAAFSQATQVWEGAKALTQKCKVIGEIRPALS